MRSNTLIVEFLETLDSLNLKGKMIPGLIMSSPGFGKTSTVELYCKLKGYNCCTLIPSHYSPDDVLGLQSLVNGELVRLTPSWFKTLTEMAKEKRTLLFIDELSTCDEFIQAPLLRLIFERKLDEKSLPDNIFIVSAGNYANELNNQFHLAAPTVNRFMILNLSTADYDVMEVCDNRFARLAKSDDTESIIKYLNTSNIEDKTPKWDFMKVRSFLSKNVIFNSPTIKDTTEDGLMGYCSIRSLNYTLEFVHEYTSHFNGETWLRVAGDTLGYRDKTESPMRKFLSENRTAFFYTGVAKESGSAEEFNLNRTIQKIVNSEDQNEKQKALDNFCEWLRMTDKGQMTQSERSQVSRLIPSLRSKMMGDESPYKDRVTKIIKEFEKKFGRS